MKLPMVLFVDAIFETACRRCDVVSLGGELSSGLASNAGSSPKDQDDR